MKRYGSIAALVLATGLVSLGAPERPVQPDAVRAAVRDMMTTFPDRYTDGPAALAQIDVLAAQLATTRVPAVKLDLDRQLSAIARKALLANPLLAGQTILAVNRNENAPNDGLPANWQGNCALPDVGFDDAVVAVDAANSNAPLKTLFRPPGTRFVGDVDLHPSGTKMLLSMPDDEHQWQVWEVGTDGQGLRQLTGRDEASADNYDACYVPDGRIVFASTRCYQGVPCVGGGTAVANLYLMDANGDHVRRLCFDQDHDWCPTVMNSGRILYTRWEYTDTPHYFTRLLMSMNPDGTGQAEVYGSNSHWPNSLFYARPVPGHPTKLVAIVSGHHGVARAGELVVFDPALGRTDAEGAVLRLGSGKPKVEAVIQDGLVNNSWPRYLHPYPLGEADGRGAGKYFLAACQPNPGARWGIYLVDAFENLTLIREEPGRSLMEPTLLRSQPPPPVIADKVKLDQTNATIYVTDVYRGPGLAGVPRGTVKSLRVFTYTYAYLGTGGHREIGVESAWEPRRILGEVPVEADGSVFFSAPANTPIAVQPLDAQGRSLQLMRSWMTAMPGESVSCSGCHESQNSTPAPTVTIAARRDPSPIAPWFGPERPFSFVAEVQPVLDRNCVSCHAPDAEKPAEPMLADIDRGVGGFTKSYLALHPFVRRPGPESDYAVLPAGEYRADTSELIQLLAKGHHDVKLSDEDWRRLYAWIDLNAPDFGTWTERYGAGRISRFHDLRQKTQQATAGVSVDPEPLPNAENSKVQRIQKGKKIPTIAVIPCDTTRTAPVVPAATALKTRWLEPVPGMKIEFVEIPAGTFRNEAGEQKIAKPFWLSRREISNAEFAQFDPDHDSRYIDQQHKDHTVRGYPANKPEQPVVRVSLQQAQAFCAWLSQRAGAKCDVPTETQWEYACRAGTATPFWFGDLATDYSTCANLGDRSIRRFAVGGVNPQPIENPSPLDDFQPRDMGVDDAGMVSVEPGRYAANPWGLFDMHGNVAEWTRPADGSAAAVARGGSWRDRPARATASARNLYDPWLGVFDVGFRVAIEEKD